MNCIRDRAFAKETVYLDGTLFIGCVFSECQLYYAGGDFDWRDTVFEQTCRLNLIGPAGRTLDLMKRMGLNVAPNQSE